MTLAPDLLSVTARGVVIAIRAMPRAGRSGIAGLRAGALLVKLSAAPADGAANAELIDLLARALDLPRRQLSIVAGDRARDKRVLVEGVALSTLQARLSAILDAKR
ncbi:MAG TPA: DUF167 domain-containing protein [Vicinamibacterales bacterium]|nr:DUF167 domain-containing protein [Vicinamibacterales bacterium]